MLQDPITTLPSLPRDVEPEDGNGCPVTVLSSSYIESIPICGGGTPISVTKVALVHIQVAVQQEDCMVCLILNNKKVQYTRQSRYPARTCARYQHLSH